MNQAITLDTQTGKDLYDLYSDLKNEITLLRKSLAKVLLTKRNSSVNNWSELSNKALEEIRNGNGYILENKHDVDKFFKDL